MKANVERTKLLRILTGNRDQHRAIYEEALDKYKTRAIEEFQARIERIRRGDPFDLYVRLPVPEDHTEDYDRIIQLLEMSSDDTIELDDADITTYVNDDWQWKKAWLANTASYTQSR